MKYILLEEVNGVQICVNINTIQVLTQGIDPDVTVIRFTDGYKLTVNIQLIKLYGMLMSNNISG